jgi:hypothetical protein
MSVNLELNSDFNAFYKEKENSFIKAVIDENNKGFLGKQNPISIVGRHLRKQQKNKQRLHFYGQISGFSMQRVDLTIVSVFTKGEIFPSIFPSMMWTE